MKNNSSAQKFLNYLILASVAIIILLVFCSPLAANELHQISNSKPVDLYLNYTPDSFYQVIGIYGETGRNFYLNEFFPTDLIFVIIYCLPFIFSFIFRTQKKLSQKILLNGVPILTGFFDILENMSFYFLISAFPTRQDNLVQLANFFTLTKYSFFAISVLVYAIVGFKKLYLRYKS